MPAERVIAGLVRVAAEDLAGARLLAAAGNRNAVYLVEQAAEKVIRAVLTSESKHAGIGHQLDAMVDEIPDENPVKALLRGVEHLSAYATAFRYPSAVGRVRPGPTRAEIEADITRVDALIAEVVKQFIVDLASPDAPAKRATPIR